MTAAALPAARRAGSAWARQGALLAGFAIVTLAIFRRDASDIARIWWTSSTFEHCLLIPPILAWLVWRARARLSASTPVLWPLGLAPVACGALLWIAGEAASVAVARHIALLLMLQGMVAALTGPQVTRVLAFPLGYALFLVPFGAELVPPLQTATAAMAMALLRLSGPSAMLDGVFITTPTGLFEVAEACAGVNFLIAMLAFAVLAAHLGFRDWRRRIAFVAFALTASILANGVRAWSTIVIAHHVGLEFAVSADHIIYGGVFFAAVLAAVLAVAWRFFDETRSPANAGAQKYALENSRDDSRVPAFAGTRGMTVVIGLAALIALAPLWSATLAAAGRDPLPHPIALPMIEGWTRSEPDAGAPWSPAYANPDHSLLGHYRDAAGGAVDLAIVMYAWQAEGRELIAEGQGAASEAWTWTADLPDPSAKAERLLGANGAIRTAVTTYHVGGFSTGRALELKLATAIARLSGRSQAAVAIVVSSRDPAALARFRRALGDPGPRAEAIVAQARGL